MKGEISELATTNINKNVTADWDGLVHFLINNPDIREKVGPAWCLLFDIYLNADEAGIYSTTYSHLAKRYGVAVPTVKTWRKQLFQNSVIESYSRGHSVAFRLLEPFRSFLKQPETGNSNERLQNILHKMLQLI